MNKQKRNKIIYWIATIWFCFGMLTSGVVQLLQLPFEVEFMMNLGYPQYFLPILGVWKILGVLAVIVPGKVILKEWAYAGFFFAMSGAAISHVAVGESIREAFPALLLLILIVISWYFRPENRKI